MCDEKLTSSSDKNTENLNQPPLKRCLVVYSRNSSIHGIKYVFCGKRNWFTRLFWTLALIASFGTCGYFLINKFFVWNYSPDIGTHKTFVNIRKIPFPAITICPQTKTKVEFLSFRKTYASYWTEFKLKASDQDAARFESLLHICEPELSYKLQLNDSKLSDGVEIPKILKEISYSIDDSMMFCKFRNSIRNCTDLFTEIMTAEGLCFSFNMLNFREIFNKEFPNEKIIQQRRNKNFTWSLDGGYWNDDLETFPYPAISQPQEGLKIILKTTDVDMDYVCKGTHQGFKVFFHLPGDAPSFYGKQIFVPIKYDVAVSLGARVTKVSENLRKYGPPERNCYLTNEKPLKFFKKYTKNLCDFECLANHTLSSCNCVEFFMPRDEKTKVCDYSKRKCFMEAMKSMMLSYNMIDNEKPDCDCLPSCTGISYDSEIFQTNFEFEKLFESYNYDLSDSPGVVMSRLVIFFQDPQFEQTERYAIFTFTDYIAACGGVLGLFMGFSILSLIELFYFIICFFAQICNRSNKKTTPKPSD